MTVSNDKMDRNVTVFHRKLVLAAKETEDVK